MYEAESSPKKSPEKGMPGSYTRRKDVRGKSAIIPKYVKENIVFVFTNQKNE